MIKRLLTITTLFSIYIFSASARANINSIELGYETVGFPIEETKKSHLLEINLEKQDSFYLIQKQGYKTPLPFFYWAIFYLIVFSRSISKFCRSIVSSFLYLSILLFYAAIDLCQRDLGCSLIYSLYFIYEFRNLGGEYISCPS